MADYFTKFSCLFDVGSAENAKAAEDVRTALAAELWRDEEVDLGFEMDCDSLDRPGVLWIHNEEHGEPEHVIAFVLRCAEAFDMAGLWGFRWALTCSRPRLDGFGGGAQLIDLEQRKTVAWIDCEHWLAGALADAGEVVT